MNIRIKKKLKELTIAITKQTNHKFIFQYSFSFFLGSESERIDKAERTVLNEQKRKFVLLHSLFLLIIKLKKKQIKNKKILKKFVSFFIGLDFRSGLALKNGTIVWCSKIDKYFLFLFFILIF